MTDLKQLAAEIESKCVQVKIISRRPDKQQASNKPFLFRRTVCVELLEALVKEERADERKRIRENIVADQATGAGDYGDAEEYADRIVRPERE